MWSSPVSAEEPRFKWNALGLENQESFSKVLSGAVPARAPTRNMSGLLSEASSTSEKVSPPIFGAPWLWSRCRKCLWKATVSVYPILVHFSGFFGLCPPLCSGGANDLPAPPGMMVKHHQRTGSGKSVQAWRQAPSRCLAPSAGLRIEQRDHHFAWRCNEAVSGVKFGSCVIAKLQGWYDSLEKRSETEIADFKIIQLKQQAEHSWTTWRQEDRPQSLTLRCWCSVDLNTNPRPHARMRANLGYC